MIEWIFTIMGLVLIFILPLAGAQFMTRLLKVKQKVPPKKIWGFVMPTKQEMFYALLAIIGLGLFMFMGAWKT